ncbi:MAG: hypothetical protein M1813_007935 [Trichoglossum hirsutum]|nr:MAG: hypothetical protein M1813_007935 [Trichoglossum hirsutum]
MADTTDEKLAVCTFCERKFSKGVLYVDEDVIAIENRRSAGTAHWLLMPTGHIRDIESLTEADLPLLHKLDALKTTLLARHHPGLPSSSVHAGYHRGRRPAGLGPLVLPDIVSVHHLHLHVIVEPRCLLRWCKYPAWLPLMWVSDESVRRKLCVKEE